MAPGSTASPTKRASSAQHAPPVDHSASSTRHTSAPHGPLSPSIKPTTHKPPRTRAVGAHRTHVRNPSGKGLNKLQRLAINHNLTGAEGDNNPRHQRKKSAPSSPATSPRTGSNVRWNGSVISLTGHGANHTSMKKNYSSPALRRNLSGILVKKNTQFSKAGEKDKVVKKKTVGFELAADSDDEDEWENTSWNSPESTRRNSVVATKMNSEDTTKSPLAQVNQAAETDPLPDGPSQKLAGPPAGTSAVVPATESNLRHLAQDDFTSRLLQRPRSSQAPATISSVSVTATPPATDRVARVPSYSTLSSSLNPRNRTELASMPSSVLGSNPQAASSSIEGGVSRFLVNNANPYHPADSDPSTPSSFLPHYHPNTPPSPEFTNARSAKSRARMGEPASRTQQKLWLQRTAVLTTSPPDHPITGPTSTISPSAMEPGLVGASNSRSASGTLGHDGRRMVIGPSGPAGINADSEAKRARKVYDRFATEFFVVQRFRGPTVDSFRRLDKLRRGDQPTSSKSHPNIASLANTNGQHHPASVRPPDSAAVRTAGSEPALNQRQLMGSNRRPASASHLRFQNQDYVADSEEPAERLDVEHQPPQRRQLTSVAVVQADGNVYEESIDDDAGGDAGSGGGVRGAGYQNHRPSEDELLIRRMWESREITEDE
ncbi:hypothetical protein AJ80_00484 [Polytolypa hystricis UAMH7299]|uniref:Uncharacterized protein n=1 Tax=Polytolypa hystricis (strain UAMH7299) TaxID=1447883 RepID=A0A2B7Z4E2_POLH7|nr:hypothetical protein AJ80_00484 [Polytolypa hystricis UAMH7299]